MAIRAPLLNSNFFPIPLKPQIHSIPSFNLTINRKRFNLSCTKDNTSDAELAAGLAAEMAKLKTQTLQKEEAMKKSKELLFKEFCKYLDLETEEVKQRWIKMDETEKLVWAKRFVSDWGESFHPLSSKSVKELVEEILVEENPNPISSSSSSAIDLNSLKKMIGF